MAEMDPYYHHPEHSFSIQSVLGAIRALTAVLGIVLILVGIVFVMRMFSVIFNNVQNPEAGGALIADWAEVLGGERLNVPLPEGVFEVAPLAAALVVGMGGLVLAWISIGIVIAGAKLVSWRVTDREAMKRMLRTVMGKKRREDLHDGAAS